MSDIENQHDREPTDDERMGMAWWNGLSKAERTFYKERTASDALPVPSAADAWAWWKSRDTSDPANTFPVYTEPFSP